MSIHRCSRRVALEALAGGGAGAVVGACGAPTGTPPTQVGTIEAGVLADYPVGSLEALGNSPVAVGRDAKGLYAMTLTCTHAGCNMAIDGNVSASGVYCSCHGSQFDANGGVTHGPAREPLAHFAITVDASGTITVHGDQEVDAAVRTPAA